MASFKRVRTEDVELNAVQDSIETSVKELGGHLLAGARLLSSTNGAAIALTTGTINRIEHGLGTPVVRWSIVGPDANANVWAVASEQRLNSRILSLQCSANVNAFILVWPG